MRYKLALVAAAVVCHAALAWADKVHFVTETGQSIASDENVIIEDRSAAFAGSEPSTEFRDGQFDGLGGCDGEPIMGMTGVFGIDAFKGVSDLQSNFGAIAGLNAAMPMRWLKNSGYGWQLGATYGGYSFDGKASGSVARSQQQLFVTTGLFRKGQRLSFGVVYDLMVNDSWGYYSIEPAIGQLRGQVEYAFADTDSIGIYGCGRGHYTQYRVGYDESAQLVCLTERAINQVNLFWHHKFDSGADSRLWIGMPEQRRIEGSSSLGDWIIGANIEAPISESWALYGNAEYVHPSAAAGMTASMEATWNVGAGVVWYFGGRAKCQSLNGPNWMPYLPVANNSTFLVDQGLEIYREPE
jgi:hypothetical protein